MPGNASERTDFGYFVQAIEQDRGFVAPEILMELRLRQMAGIVAAVCEVLEEAIETARAAEFDKQCKGPRGVLGLQRSARVL